MEGQGLQLAARRPRLLQGDGEAGRSGVVPSPFFQFKASPAPGSPTEVVAILQRTAKDLDFAINGAADELVNLAV